MLATHAHPRATACRTLPLITLLVTLIACVSGNIGDPTPPPPQGPEPIAPNDIPVRTLRLGDTVAVDRNSSIERLVYVSPRAQRLAIYYACTSGDVVVRRVPSLGFPVVFAGFVGPGACGSPLLSRWQFDSAAVSDSVIIEVAKRTGSTGIRLTLVAQDTLPEQEPRSVSVGDTVAGLLEHPADEDVFDVVPPGPGTYVLYAQSSAPAGAGPLRFSFEAPADLSRVPVTSGLRDPDLESLRSGRFVLRDGRGSARLRVRSAGFGAPAPGPMNYRMQVRRVDAAVESGASQLTIGTMVSSALEHSADVDRFEVVLPDTSRYVVYFRHRTGPPSGRMGIRLPAPAQDPTLYVGTLASRLGDPSRYGTAVILRGIEYAGSNQRVSFAVAPAREGSPGESGALQIDRGTYDVEVVRIEQAPEQAPTVLRLNDSVTVERLDRPLDVDVFALVGDYERAIVHVRAPPGSIGAQFDGAGDFEIDRIPGQPVFLGREIFRENPGDTVWIPVNSVAELDGDVTRYYEGPYVLTFREIRTAPETAQSVLQPNQIISESLEFPGDVDRFTYTAADQERIRIRVAGAVHVALSDSLFRPDPTPANGALAAIGEAFEMFQGQVLQIEVVPPRGGTSLRDVGPYRLQVERLP